MTTLRALPDPGRRSLARLAGGTYAVLILCGIFAEFFVRQKILVADDPVATFTRLTDNEGLYRLGLVADSVMIICDVLVAWALYGLLRPAARWLAGLAAAFRLVHAAVLAANLILQAVGLSLLGVSAGQDSGLISLLALETHALGYLIAQVFFGVHCVLLGWLLLRTLLTPRLLGGLMLVGGVGYMVESFVIFLAPELAAVGVPGVAIAGLTEIAFCIWLLLRPVPGDRARKDPA